VPWTSPGPPGPHVRLLPGGKDHWQADRQAAEQILAAPEVRAIAPANRGFLRRVVIG
jgi:hypothetical protein